MARRAVAKAMICIVMTILSAIVVLIAASETDIAERLVQTSPDARHAKVVAKWDMRHRLIRADLRTRSAALFVMISTWIAVSMSLFYPWESLMPIVFNAITVPWVSREILKVRKGIREANDTLTVQQVMEV